MQSTLLVLSLFSTLQMIIAQDTSDITIGNEQVSISNLNQQSRKKQNSFFKRACPLITGQMKTQCLQSAQSATGAADNVQEDLAFFKTCIVDYYCFKKHSNKDIWTSFPTFKSLIGTAYFNAAAKRVQFFFIRYNTWSNTLVDPKFRDVSTGSCLNLLYVIAARYLYVVYVLNKIRWSELTFGPCTNMKVPESGVCFLTPLTEVTCTSDHDVALLGKRSGTIASQFNKFFTESVSGDAWIPGYSKSSSDLFDTNVYAFTVEYAMPQIFNSLTTDFTQKVSSWSTDWKMIILEIVTAISKMATFNPKYYEELLVDSGEFDNRPGTIHNLKGKFHGWKDKINTMNDALKQLKESPYYRKINFRRQLNMAYEQVTGLIEDTINGVRRRDALSEMVMALMYNVEAYHTRGSVRHIVGWTQMNRADVLSTITINDFWCSMLENWADTNKEYKRECEDKNVLITVCLPKISKYFWRMLDAMFAVYNKLKPTLQAGLVIVDNTENTGVRSIMSHWFTNVKRRGLNGIPSDDRLPKVAVGTTNLDLFLQGMNCNGQSKTAQLSRNCMNAIHEIVRHYNRNLFIQLIESDSAGAGK